MKVAEVLPSLVNELAEVVCALREHDAVLIAALGVSGCFALWGLRIVAWNACGLVTRVGELSLSWVNIRSMFYY